MRIAASDKQYEGFVRKLAENVQARRRYHSIELPNGDVLPGLQSTEHLRWRLGLFGLADDLRGKRVLDIGAWDGWFSFECERRGAEVMAVDCVELDTFLEARDMLGSKVEYLTLDVNELSAKRLGRFDIVLFLGVLYHLRHPLLGLEKAVELSTELALVESFVIARESRRAVPSVMEFYERGELGGQIDNWCGPSPECLLAMCRSAGFAQAELKDITNQRASVVCRRRWPAPGTGAPPHLHSAVNNRDYTARFHPAKEEYVCCYFKSAEKELSADNVFIEVDGYGVPVLTVSASGPGAYQANCLRPPGLQDGPHEVRVRTGDSARSNAVEISMTDEAGNEVTGPALEMPPTPAELCAAESSASSDLRLRAGRGGNLVVYFRFPADRLRTSYVTVDAGGDLLAPLTISSLEPGVWQANVMPAAPIASGTPVRVRLGEGAWSNTLPCKR